MQYGIRLSVVVPGARRLSEESMPTQTGSCAGVRIGACAHSRATAAAESENIPPPSMLTLALLASIVEAALRTTRPR
jgi:hypothetical protein